LQANWRLLGFQKYFRFSGTGYFVRTTVLNISTLCVLSGLRVTRTATT